MQDIEIINEILNTISTDWGIRDDVISRMLNDLCPGRLVFLEDLVSGKVKPEAEDIVDLLNVREKLRRTYALKAGRSLGMAL